MSGLTFDALRVLFYLSNTPVPAEVPAEICRVDSQRGVLAELVQGGWVYPDESDAGTATFGLRADRRGAAVDLRPTYRTALAQRRLLEHISAHPDQGSTADLAGHDDFSGPLTEQEVLEAGEDLKERGLIKGIEVSGAELIRPELTSPGRQALRSPYAPEQDDDRRSQGARGGQSMEFHSTFNGPVGAVQQGAHNEATVTQDNTWGDLTTFMDLLGEIRTLVRESNGPAGAKGVVLEQLDTIEAGVEQRKSRGWFEMSVQALLSAGAAELADGIGPLITQAMGALGA